MRKHCLTILMLFLLPLSLFASPGCKTRFVNPVTDISWKSIFPLTIGSVPLVPSLLELPDTANPGTPIAWCPDIPPVGRLGLTMGYWEPHSLVDITRIPYCMVNMGFEMPIGINQQQVGGSSSSMDNEDNAQFYQVHWYKYPVTYLLNLIASVFCLQAEGVDLAYMSELDPLWDSDVASFILNPEAILFGNPITQLACIAESVAKSLPFALNTGVMEAFDFLFWCAGAQGSMYPLTGTVPHSYSTVSNAVLLAERMNFKLHRQGMIFETKGVVPIVCQQFVAPILPKSRYRYQFTNYVPQPFMSHPYGTTTMLSEAGKDNLVTQSNFGILNFHKRNCVFL